MKDIDRRLLNWARYNRPARKANESNLMMVIRNAVNNPNYIPDAKESSHTVTDPIDVTDALLIDCGILKLPKPDRKLLICYWIKRLPIHIMAKRNAVSETMVVASLLSIANRLQKIMEIVDNSY